jgi:hypothetical protein
MARLLVFGFLLQRPGFGYRPRLAGFVMAKVTGYFALLPVSITPPALYTQIIYNFNATLLKRQTDEISET